MKVPMKRGLLGLTLLMLVTMSLAVQAQTARYLNFADLTSELRGLVDGAQAATMRSIGQSPGGRDIWVVEVANPQGTSLDQRPGLLIVGNLEGDHLLGSHLVLETLRHLLSSGEADLDNQVFYLVPRFNPDGAEGMFARVRYDRRRNDRPYDDDNDGRTDEDPPEDLNGDGIISVMRVPDPTGAYLVHPDNPRLMKKADPAQGETGTHKLYWEGSDSDADGFFNEDGAGGVDLNRNFQHVYPYWERDAGPHMVSEPESRALMEFVIAHRNIGAILTYGHSDNLVTPPDNRGNLGGFSTLDLPSFANASLEEIFETGVFREGRRGRGGFGRGGGGGLRLRGAQPGRDNDPNSGRRPAESIHRQDLEYFKAVSDAYKEITDIQKVVVNREAKGAFFQYGYFQFGVPSFSTQGWAMPSSPESESAGEEREEGQRPAGRRGRSARSEGENGGGLDDSLLSAMEAAGIDGFLDWTSYDHPDLGQVELGGFKPYAATNPPASSLTDLGSQHAEFALRVASMLPRVRIVDTQVTSHGGGVFTVGATIENTGFFPTSLQHGIVARAVDPTTVQIQIDPEMILTGDEKTSTIEKLDGSGARADFSWVIRAEPGTSVEIQVRSQKGGSDSTSVTLR